MIAPRWGYMVWHIINPALRTGLMIYAPLVLENCKLLNATKNLSLQEVEELIPAAEELCRMLGSAQKTLRTKIELSKTKN